MANSVDPDQAASLGEGGVPFAIKGSDQGQSALCAQISLSVA